MDGQYTMFKVALVGDAGVGKTCLINQIIDGLFGNNLYLNNIGIDFGVKNFVINGKGVKLQLWDTAGQERFRTMTSSYYRGASGIIMVYDITNLESLNGLESWLEEIDNYGSCKPDVSKLLVGTKCDLTVTDYHQGEEVTRKSHNKQWLHHHTPSSAHRLLQVGDDSYEWRDLRAVNFDTAKNFAEKHNLMGVIETSAKDSTNVELAFVTLAADMLQKTSALSNFGQSVNNGNTVTSEQSHVSKSCSCSLF